MKKFFIFFLIFLFFSLGTFKSFGLIRVRPEQIKYLDNETEVQIKGIVISRPGTLGLQIFYINGCQIYSYYKDFPDLVIGNQVLVKGIISQSRGEKRVKIKTAKDIIILERNLPVIAKKIEIKEVKDNLVGSLIQVEGRVLEKTGLYIYLDDGLDELTVYIKDHTNIDKSIIKEGCEIKITGILSKYNNQLRLLPREKEDILITKSPVSKKEIINYQLISSSTSIFDFEEIKFYFIIISSILGIVFVSFILIKKNKND